MRLKFALGFLGFCLLSPCLLPQSDTVDNWIWEDGNVLFEECSAAQNTVEFTRCLAYIAGAADMIGNFQLFKSDGNKPLFTTRICIPVKATRGQLTDVVIKYMKDHPESRTDSASLIVMRALVQVWKCSGADTK